MTASMAVPGLEGWGRSVASLPIGQLRWPRRPASLLTDRSVSSMSEGDGVSTPAEREPAARRGGGRDRILAAATSLFVAKGYSDVWMADVAREAKVTKAALYYHFADKQDLYTTVALGRIDAIGAAMADAVGEGTLEERLTRLA